MLSKTYREIEEMVRRSLLHTKTARDIVRKSMVTATPQQEEAVDLDSPSLWGQYSDVNHATWGSVVTYPALEYFPFPSSATGTPSVPNPDAYSGGETHLLRFGDWLGVDEVRLLVTVTEAGGVDSTLYLKIWRDATWGDALLFTPTEVPFTFSSPEVPLDEVGLHVTDWHQIDWPEEATIPVGGGFPPPNDESFPLRPAVAKWWVNNPSSSPNSAGIGLCQLQARSTLV